MTVVGKTFSILGLSFLVFSPACRQPTSQEMNEPTKKVVIEAFSALLQKDQKAFLSHIHPDSKLYQSYSDEAQFRSYSELLNRMKIHNWEINESASFDEGKRLRLEIQRVPKGQWDTFGYFNLYPQNPNGTSWIIADMQLHFSESDKLLGTEAEKWMKAIQAKIKWDARGVDVSEIGIGDFDANPTTKVDWKSKPAIQQLQALKSALDQISDKTVYVNFNNICISYEKEGTQPLNYASETDDFIPNYYLVIRMPSNGKIISAEQIKDYLVKERLALARPQIRPLDK